MELVSLEMIAQLVTVLLDTLGQNANHVRTTYVSLDVLISISDYCINQIEILDLNILLILSVYGSALCDLLSCQNGGMCISDGRNASCHCSPGYLGATCDQCK